MTEGSVMSGSSASLSMIVGRCSWCDVRAWEVLGGIRYSWVRGTRLRGQAGEPPKHVKESRERAGPGAEDKKP